MKKGLLLLLLPLFLLTASIALAAELIVATDLHYISPTLTDHGACFTGLVENGDAKLSMYCEELTDAFIAEVLARKPDALILSGDLTFNGAPESHEVLAAKLQPLLDAGITVLVIPGNHDVYNYNAACFTGDTFTRLGPTTSNRFRDIWHAFGYDGAIAADSDSLSYVYELEDGTRILMLDFNTFEHPCGYSDMTLVWIEEQLRQGIDIAVGHQNLLQHSVFRTGYVICGSEALTGLMERYGVRLYLSGHMHIQHIAESGSVTDIATSSLCVSPCQYGILSTEPLSYRTVTLDVEACAAANGLTDEHLLHFTDYAAAFFDAVTLRRVNTEDETVRAYLCLINRCYFSGRMDLVPLAEVQALAANDPDGLLSTWLSRIEADLGRNYTVWQAR